MSTPDPKALAVLLDALCAAYGYTRGQAEEAEKYARNIGAVRDLIKHSPVGPEEYVEDEWQSICRDCGVNVDPARESGHLARCLIVAAWRALGDPRGAADIKRAWDEALRESLRREVRRARLARAANSCTHRHLRSVIGSGEGSLTCVDCAAIVGEVEVTRIDTGTALPTPLWRTYNEPGTMFTHAGELTASRQRSDVRARDFAIGAAVATRQHSDARGMEAVEDEAEDENNRRAYPEVHGPPQLLPDRAG